MTTTRRAIFMLELSPIGHDCFHSNTLSVRLSRLRSIYFSLDSLLFLSLLPRLRRHQVIQFRVPRELVGKRHKGTPHLPKPISGINIRDIGELQIRNIEKLGKLHPVSAGLIQHDNKFAVRGHGAGCMTLQQIIHILRNPRTKNAILSNPLPEREQKVGAIFVLEQKLDFIDKDKRILASGTILRNPI